MGKRAAAVGTVLLWLTHFLITTPALYHETKKNKGLLDTKEITNESAQSKKPWPVLKVSDSAQRIENKLRSALVFLKVPRNKSFTPIYMNLGDPSVGGNLPPDDNVLDALHAAVDDRSFDGYGPSIGLESARKAIVHHFSTKNAPFTADDVIMTSGATHALLIAIEAIADPGDNILVPTPGFPVYTSHAKSLNVEPREYQLILKRGGYINLHQLESLIDNRTKAILINNPANPTGSVFSRSMLRKVVKIAYRHKVIIIADEIYGELVYNGARFYPLAEFQPKVPMIVCDAISKRYLVPGWRLGWLIIHNRYGVLDNVKSGMTSLTLRILGPSMVLQGALPSILENTPHRAIRHVQRVIGKNANIMYQCLSKIYGLQPLRSYGSIFMVVKFDSAIYGNEKEFIGELISKKSLYVIPGHVFQLPNWFRIVLTYPCPTTREACNRIESYCNDVVSRRKLKEHNEIIRQFMSQRRITMSNHSEFKPSSAKKIFYNDTSRENFII